MKNRLIRVGIGLIIALGVGLWAYSQEASRYTDKVGLLASTVFTFIVVIVPIAYFIGYLLARAKPANSSMTSAEVPNWKKHGRLVASVIVGLLLNIALLISVQGAPDAGPGLFLPIVLCTIFGFLWDSAMTR